MICGKNVSYYLLLIALMTGSATVLAKDTVGWIERVKIHPGDVTIRAKLDTGAKTSSLNCECITPIERNGEKWVKFTVTNDKGKSVSLERKIHRYVTIKRHFGEEQRRMVIMLGVCLKGVYKETEVNLVDRSGFNYPMLIGREFMAGSFVIDPGETFTSKPDCRRVEDAE